VSLFHNNVAAQRWGSEQNFGSLRGFSVPLHRMTSVWWDSGTVMAPAGEAVSFSCWRRVGDSTPQRYPSPPVTRLRQFPSRRPSATAIDCPKLKID